MHVAFGRTALIALGLMLTLVSIGCSAPPAGPSVPTFTDPSLATGAIGAAEPDDGAVPDDCAKLITTGDLGALLGLPLDSVTLRTTRHVGSATVGRTERVACEYSGQGAVRGRVLQLDASSYTSESAARQQWQVNIDAEDGTQRELPIGAASAVLVERRNETVLRVVHGASNLAIVLPKRPLPDGRTAADTLVDLALRVIPAVDAAPTAATGSAGSAQGSGNP